MLIVKYMMIAIVELVKIQSLVDFGSSRPNRKGHPDIILLMWKNISQTLNIFFSNQRDYFNPAEANKLSQYERKTMTHDLGYPEESRHLELIFVFEIKLAFLPVHFRVELKPIESVRFLVGFQTVKNLPRHGRADETANGIISTFDLILIRFGTCS